MAWLPTHACLDCGASWLFDLAWLEEDVEVEHFIATNCRGRVVRAAPTWMESFSVTMRNAGMTASEFESRVAKMFSVTTR